MRATRAGGGSGDAERRPAAARGARAPGPAHRRACGVDQGRAEEARAARVRPLRRASRRDLHARARPDGLPRAEDRLGAGPRACCRRRRPSARARRRGLERAVSRAPRRARPARRIAADAEPGVLGDRADPDCRGRPLLHSVRRCSACRTAQPGGGPGRRRKQLASTPADAASAAARCGAVGRVARRCAAGPLGRIGGCRRRAGHGASAGAETTASRTDAAGRAGRHDPVSHHRGLVGRGHRCAAAARSSRASCSRARRSALDGAAPLRVRIGNAAGTRVSFRGQPMELAAYTRDNVARLELK